MPAQDEPQWPSEDSDANDGVTDAEQTVTDLTDAADGSGEVDKTDTYPVSGDGATVEMMLPAAAGAATPMRIEPTESGNSTRTADAADVNASADEPAPSASDNPSEPPTDSETTAPGRPRRRGRTVLFAGLALVLVIALGAVLALPSVANRLALPWAQNKPLAESPAPVAATRDLQVPPASAPSPTVEGVRSALAELSKAPALGTLTGSVVDPVAGTTLWDENSSQTLTPASTTKILTSAAALLAVDPGLQLSTKVVEGSEPGTVVLVGGGDPTLSSLPMGKESVYPGAAHLDDLVAQVKAATGGQVRKVQLDSSLFTGPRVAPGWAPEDTPSTYAVPVVAGMLDGGRTNATDPKSPRTADPSGALLTEFAKRLGASAQTGSAKPVTSGKVLGEVRSAPLTELIDYSLRTSDNLLADVIARQTAIATGAEPSFAGGAKATLDVLAQHGFDVSTSTIADGSGLSTVNKVPAKLLSALISAAAAPDGASGNGEQIAKLRPLLGGLPVAGGSGTLSDRYLEPASAKGKGWIRAKTGTLSGVNTLAGLVLDADGRVLTFALMTASSAPWDDVRQALDAITAALRGCGCR